jgi:hypothetical protein
MPPSRRKKDAEFYELLNTLKKKDKLHGIAVHPQNSNRVILYGFQTVAAIDLPLMVCSLQSTFEIAILNLIRSRFTC